MSYTPGYRNGAHPNDGQPGTLYLLHLDPGLPMDDVRTCRHYLGWTDRPVAARLAEHLSGQGSPMIRAAVERGQTVTLVRIWEGGTRNLERQLKRRRKHKLLCPHCNPALGPLELPA